MNHKLSLFALFFIPLVSFAQDNKGVFDIAGNFGVDYYADRTYDHPHKRNLVSFMSPGYSGHILFTYKKDLLIYPALGYRVSQVSGRFSNSSGGLGGRGGNSGDFNLVRGELTGMLQIPLAESEQFMFSVSAFYGWLHAAGGNNLSFSYSITQEMRIKESPISEALKKNQGGMMIRLESLIPLRGNKNHLTIGLYTRWESPMIRGGLMSFMAGLSAGYCFRK